MNKSLLPLTKLVLAVSAVVLGVFGLSWLVAPGFVNSVLWPPPFQPIPPLWLRYDAALYLTMSLGGAYALYQNNWIAARSYLAITGPYIAMNIVLTLVAALTPPGVPLVMWAYLALALVYLPTVVWVWLQETARARKQELQVEYKA
jgi:hypothetical protein